MALARKGSRKIVVEGSEYRWTVSADDEAGVGIVVEDHNKPACRLVKWVDHGLVISPAVVRGVIVEALAIGWRPREPGPDFVRSR